MGSRQASPGPSNSHLAPNMELSNPLAAAAVPQPGLGRGAKGKGFMSTIAAQSEDVKYQAKYKDLKRKVREIESDNDKLHFKVLQAKRNIQRMKIERAILYERLSQVPHNSPTPQHLHLPQPQAHQPPPPPVPNLPPPPPQHVQHQPYQHPPVMQHQQPPPPPPQMPMPHRMEMHPHHMQPPLTHHLNRSHSMPGGSMRTHPPPPPPPHRDPHRMSPPPLTHLSPIHHRGSPPMGHHGSPPMLSPPISRRHEPPYMHAPSPIAGPSRGVPGMSTFPAPMLPSPPLPLGRGDRPSYALRSPIDRDVIEVDPPHRARSAGMSIQGMMGPTGGIKRSYESIDRDYHMDDRDDREYRDRGYSRMVLESDERGGGSRRNSTPNSPSL